MMWKQYCSFKKSRPNYSGFKISFFHGAETVCLGVASSGDKPACCSYSRRKPVCHCLAAINNQTCLSFIVLQQRLRRTICKALLHAKVSGTCPKCLQCCERSHILWSLALSSNPSADQDIQEKISSTIWVHEERTSAAGINWIFFEELVFVYALHLEFLRLVA